VQVTVEPDGKQLDGSAARALPAQNPPAAVAAKAAGKHQPNAPAPDLPAVKIPKSERMSGLPDVNNDPD
jgi:hypothetical protein